jgi:sulfopyruvate decarboxylase TPP-binding subunit
LNENEVRLVAYVPDNVPTPLIRGTPPTITSSVSATPEDEAVGAATEVYMAGLGNAVIMQTINGR